MIRIRSIRETELAQTNGESVQWNDKDNTSIADYVWLPIRSEGEKPIMEWKDSWKLEDYE